jgi:hypothetical protein
VYYLRLGYRAHFGNVQGEQVSSFSVAVARVKTYFQGCGCQVVLETMTLAKMRTDGLSFEGLIDWLLGSHVHFLITHPHQGLENHVDLSVAEIYEEVERLRYHCGYPSLDKLDCPIFRQDKWKYLQDLGNDMTARTIKIPLVEEVEVQPIGAGPHNFAALFPTIATEITK